ncbi:hypothetical protein DRN73_03165 [Candidatus Pacearchaeota archaeon]|nr:MAG: hypothetical protein DRN73_03165 [Candidatus Pacearchaeota archaeon]
MKEKRGLYKFILLFALVIVSILVINAGNIIVKEGQLNVSKNFYVGTNDFFVNTTSGYVGIGTSTPQNKLNVVGDTNITGNGYFAGGTELKSDGDVTIGDDISMSNSGKIIWSGGDITGGSNGLTFSTPVDTNPFYFSTGKVGIGTSTPQNKLNVVGDSNFTENATFEKDVIIEGTLFGGSPLDIGSDLNVSNKFFVNTTSGYVGINTTSPIATLTAIGKIALGYDNTINNAFGIAIGNSNEVHSNGGIAIGAGSVTDSSVAVAIGRAATASGSYGIAIGHYVTASGTDSMALGEEITASGTNTMAIGLDDTTRTVSQSNTMAIMGGKVGIGTVSPTTALEVNGNINATGFYYGNGSQLTDAGALRNVTKTRYQEDSDSTACAVDWSISYPCSNVYDGNWSTYGIGIYQSPNYDGGIYYANYTVPNGAVPLYWQVKDGSGTANLSLSSCSTGSNLLQFKVYGDAQLSSLNWYCWTGSAWSSLRSGHNIAVYEEAVYWTLPLYEIKTKNMVDMQNQNIINVADPKSNQDAATKKYVDDKISKTRSIFLPVLYPSATYGDYDPFSTARINNVGSEKWEFVVPRDFSLLTKGYIYIIPDATETINYDIYSYKKNVSSQYSAGSTASDTGLTKAVTSGELTTIDITSYLSSLSLSGGDIVIVRIESNYNYMHLYGFEMIYKV